MKCMPDFRDRNSSIISDLKHLEYFVHTAGFPAGKFSEETLRYSQSMMSRKVEPALVNEISGDIGDTKSNNIDNNKASFLSLPCGSIPSITGSLFWGEFPSL
ncbi:hypothetical protein SAY86_020765 [Trapa natans]|uniref:Uncharacterized protein n=1 Tax=Trapa natans TaxID=22666 RepID=A0AAN7M111_TRANT|nr:hypothetical protein SAY86_020765 [Trapa natans]